MSDMLARMMCVFSEIAPTFPVHATVLEHGPDT